MFAAKQDVATAAAGSFRGAGGTTSGEGAGVDRATSLYRTRPARPLRGRGPGGWSGPRDYPRPPALHMLSIMKFTKMHGIGNDYVYVDGFDSAPPADPAAVARKVADRHFGVGGDGLILVLPSDKADVRMRMFNADGSEAEMCGNGVRCVAKYAYDHGRTQSNPMTVETGRGVLTLSLQTGKDGKVRRVTVDMGTPILELPEVPVDRDKVVQGVREHEYRLSIAQGNELLDATFVSMGNPHAVF